MKSGTQVSRHNILTLRNGDIVVDWGDGHCQDVRSGLFSTWTEQDVSHTTLDEEFEVLRKAGFVEKFDSAQVFFISLPDSPKRTIE
jgi:hypothetical protein